MGLKPLEPKLPDCFPLKSTKLTQIHLANTVELRLTLDTVLAPVADQVKLGSGSWFLMSWGSLENKWLDMFYLSTSKHKLL